MFRNLVFVDVPFRRAESQAVITRAGPRKSYALPPKKSGPRDLQVAFSGAVSPCHDPGAVCNCTPDAIALQCGSKFG